MPSVRESMLEFLKKECTENHISFEVMDAIIQVESSWNPWAVRYEPMYMYTTSPVKFARLNKISAATEINLQKTSWGLGQLMGGTARGSGYTGMLTELLKPELNIQWSSAEFSFICTKYKSKEDQIAAYNAGAPKRLATGEYVNQDYVDKVLAAMQRSS